MSASRRARSLRKRAKPDPWRRRSHSRLGNDRKLSRNCRFHGKRKLTRRRGKTYKSIGIDCSAGREATGSDEEGEITMDERTDEVVAEGKG